MTFRKKKVFFIIIAGLIALFIIGTLALLLDINILKPRIEAAASNTLRMEVRIRGGMGIALFPSFSILLKDLSVKNNGADVVTVEKMRIGLELLPLLKHEVRIRRIGLGRPVFTLVRDKNGMFNFERPHRAVMKRLLEVEQMSVSQGKLVYTDEKSGMRIETDSFDAAIRNFSYYREGSAEPFDYLSFAGDIKCKTLAINNYTLTNLSLRAAGKKGTLDINSIRMDIFGGTGNGSVQLDMRGVSPRYRVIAALNGFRIDDLVQTSVSGKDTRKSIEGTADLSADLTATGKSADEIKRSLGGTIALSGENLVLNGLDIDALIPKYERSQNFNLVDIGAFYLAGPFGPALTKSYNFADLYKESRGGKGTIKKLVSIWKIRDGVAEASDVALASKKYRVALKGGVNFVSGQLVDVTVAVIEKRGCAVYSQKVSGPFRKPKFEKVSIFQSIAGPVLNVFEDVWKLIRGGKCTVFYSGSVADPGGG